VIKAETLKKKNRRKKEYVSEKYSQHDNTIKLATVIENR
jgi:hypothetical protein